jgi:hypothetical protein
MSLIVVTSFPFPQPPPIIVELNRQPIIIPQENFTDTINVLDENLDIIAELPSRKVRFVLTSPNRDWFAVVRSSRITVFSLDTMEILSENTFFALCSVNVSPDGLIVVSTYAKHFDIMNPFTGIIVSTFRILEGRSVVKCFRDGYLCNNLELDESSILFFIGNDRPLPLDDRIMDFCVSHDYMRVVLLKQRRLEIRSDDLMRNDVQNDNPAGGTLAWPGDSDIVNDIMFSLDDSIVFLTYEIRTIRLFSSIDLLPLRTIEVPDRISGSICLHELNLVYDSPNGFIVLNPITGETEEHEILGQFKLFASLIHEVAILM